MTRYEHGILSKCAEYGIDQQSGRKLMEKKGIFYRMEMTR